MSEIQAIYNDRIERLTAEASAIASKDRLVAGTRIVVFLAAIACLFIGWASGGSRLFYGLGAVGIASFVAVVGYHDSLKRRLLRVVTRRQINQEGLARLSRDWSKLPASDIEATADMAAVARDLDLFGRSSLFQLVNRADTQIGQVTLRDWLLEPASPEVIEERQLAAMALQSSLDLRENFNVEGRLLGESTAGPATFVAWATGAPWLLHRPWLLWMARIVPAIGLSIVVLAVAGLLSAEVVGFGLLAVVVVNSAISVVFTGQVHDIFNMVSTRNGEVGRYVKMFELMYDIPDSTERLVAIKNDVTLHDRSALHRLHQLRRIVWCARISHDPIFFVLYILLQLFFMWDFHVLARLELWQRSYGKLAGSWFNALGEFEALASLASLKYENPTWCFPSVSASHDKLTVTDMGHGLLTDDERVDNDVSVGPPGTFLLVTGSNMSGKSTLLRAIGINAVLAEAGAPVCASSWTMPPVTVATSMRISDSLQDHVSFFMAELRRLKEILDQATDAAGSERRLLFLLDEILQGTNSTERHIAVVEVLRHLLSSKTFGAISTHDLELAKSEQLADSFTAVHLRETIHGSGDDETMTFDYKVRPGVAPTTNALRLLELVGLRDRHHPEP
ncbi:MAG: DNA mismatch repair protein [Planctomycetaceae bacterium]|nr:DNA mismatch repair protein [Planctomycetaceae bacterium]